MMNVPISPKMLRDCVSGEEDEVSGCEVDGGYTADSSDSEEETNGEEENKSIYNDRVRVLHAY